MHFSCDSLLIFFFFQFFNDICIFSCILCIFFMIFWQYLHFSVIDRWYLHFCCNSLTIFMLFLWSLHKIHVLFAIHSRNSCFPVIHWQYLHFFHNLLMNFFLCDFLTKLAGFYSKFLWGNIFSKILHLAGTFHSFSRQFFRFSHRVAIGKCLFLSLLISQLFLFMKEQRKSIDKQNLLLI